jgi:hypothetical protein
MATMEWGGCAGGMGGANGVLGRPANFPDNCADRPRDDGTGRPFTTPQASARPSPHKFRQSFGAVARFARFALKVRLRLPSDPPARPRCPQLPANRYILIESCLWGLPHVACGDDIGSRAGDFARQAWQGVAELHPRALCTSSSTDEEAEHDDAQIGASTPKTLRRHGCQAARVRASRARQLAWGRVQCTPGPFDCRSLRLSSSQLQRNRHAAAAPSRKAQHARHTVLRPCSSPACLDLLRA